MFAIWLANLTVSSHGAGQAGSGMLLFHFGYIKAQNHSMNQQAHDCFWRTSMRNAVINAFFFLWILDEPCTLGFPFVPVFPFG